MAKSKTSKLKKVLIIVCSCLLAVVLALGIFLLVWFYADSYGDFESFTQRFAIPALEDGVVPQGLGNYGDTFFVSNYMVDGSASRLYVVDGGDEKYVTFTYGGETYDGHCGGVATDGNYIWICSDEYIYTADYNEVIAAADTEGAVVEFTARTETQLGTAFLFYDGGTLYVGEFYRKQNYPTDESHHITTPSGDNNTAIVLAYPTENSANGLSEAPSFALSITERIQGFAVLDGKICLSQSYGLADSHIYVYDAETCFDGSSSETDWGAITIGGEQLKLYYLDSHNLINDYDIPSMSEGLCVYDGEVYVLFESAGKKYRLFVRERMYNVYSFVPVAE